MKNCNELLDRSVVEVDKPLKPHRPEHAGRPAELPPIKLTELLAEEPDNVKQDKTGNSTPPKPHRPEHAGRPAELPPIKLTELLAEEPDNADSREIDTGPAVGKEIW